MKIGLKKELIASSPRSHFKFGGDLTAIPLLEIHPVDAIYNTDFGIDRVNEVRHTFISQCITGFAYQDIYGFTRENIIDFGLAKEKWQIKDRG